jgi:hypothetical protein
MTVGRCCGYHHLRRLMMSAVMKGHSLGLSRPFIRRLQHSYGESGEASHISTGMPTADILLTRTISLGGRAVRASIWSELHGGLSVSDRVLDAALERFWDRVGLSHGGRVD